MKTLQKREERKELEGLDVMRQHIVTEAVHDEEGQEGEKKAESEKVILCWPY